MKKQPKQGYLGQAFHEWLEYLEYVECVYLTDKRPPKQKWMALNDTLFRCDSDEDFTKMMDDAMPVDAWLAKCVRSSVKYKTTAETLGLMCHQYEEELRYITNTRPIHLPHEWCTLVIEGMGEDTFMICLQETTTSHGKPYPELGVEADEKWISANICFYRPSGVDVIDVKSAWAAEGSRPSKIHAAQRLSYCPIEIHLTKGNVWKETTTLNAQARGIEITDKGKHAIDMCTGLIVAWLNSFHLASVLRHKTAGVAPMPQGWMPKKPRKRRKFPRFEHVVIEMEVDQPDSSQTGRSVFQPKKRLHQVRGFFRHMRSGKTVWVKPHWRGDEHLGVVRSDVEMTMHDNNEGDNNVNESKAIRSKPAGQADQSGRTGHRRVLRDGSDTIWDRTRKALGAAWLSVVRTSR